MKTLFKFSADWCNPCKLLSFTLSEMDLSGYEVLEINVDNNREECKDRGIRSVPTLIIVDESGKEIARKSGNMTKEQLENFLKV